MIFKKRKIVFSFLFLGGIASERGQPNPPLQALGVSLHCLSVLSSTVCLVSGESISGS